MSNSNAIAMRNSTFVHELDDAGDRKKLAAVTGRYLIDVLRERSVARQVVPPQTVTPSECQVSVNHDTLVKVVELEPHSRAMALTFRGQPQTRLVQANRALCPFFNISSEHFFAYEEELLSYGMPITRVIEDNSLRDIEMIEDYWFFFYTELAITQTGQDVAGIEGVEAGLVSTIGEVQREDMVGSFRQIDAVRKLRSDLIVMTEFDWDGLFLWTLEDWGDKVASEVVVEGYKYTKLFGKRVIRTIKSDLIQRGNIYVFCPPDQLGRFYVLNSTKFYVDKRGNRIEWWVWETIGMLIAQIRGAAKVHLWNAQYAIDFPALTSYPDEEDVGTLINNQAPTQVFPQVNQF